jgi:hypothetical protein
MRRGCRACHRPAFIHQQRLAAGGGYINAEEISLGHGGHSRLLGNQVKRNMPVTFEVTGI